MYVEYLTKYKLTFAVMIKNLQSETDCSLVCKKKVSFPPVDWKKTIKMPCFYSRVDSLLSSLFIVSPKI